MVDPTSIDNLSKPRRRGFGQLLLSRRTLRHLVLWIGPPLITVIAFLLFARYADHQVADFVQQDDKAVGSLQLKELIRQVKKELVDADQEAIANGEPALFTLKEFELDVNVVAKGAAGGKAEIMTIGSNVDVSRERVQHIHLAWTPNSDIVAIKPKPASITDKADEEVTAREVKP